MKKIIFFFTSLLAFVALKAQSLEQGNQQLYYERYSSAENTFHQLLQQDAGNVSAWFGLTKSYLMQDELNKANDTLQKAPDAVRSNPWYKVAYGSILLQQGKKEEAATYFNDALNDTREKDAGILASIAEAHINADYGDGNYAIDLLNKALKRDKKNASFYVLMGDAYRKLSNSSEAFKAYQKATELNDKYALAYYRLGEIFVTQKNPEVYVEYFKKSVAADPNFAPSLYRLYVYEFNHDPVKAMDYYKSYTAKSDASIQNEYDLADLLFVNKQFGEAIQKANAIAQKEGDKVQPRLYKLISYSYAEQKDSAKAFDYMQQYFSKEADSNFVSRDYLLMGQLYASTQGNDSLAFTYFDKAVNLEKDSAELANYYKSFANLAASKKNYEEQAKWLGKYYELNTNASNVDLFNWALAYYKAGDYMNADTVFGKYVAKYPDQSFGYYWQAKSKALQDEDMKQGIAVPAYKKLIEVLEKDTTDQNYKKWITDAYAYLAAYETNTEGDYSEAIDYFQKVLEVDPENADAKKYIAILEKSLDDNKGSK